MKVFHKLALVSAFTLSASTIVLADEYNDLRASSSNMTRAEARKVDAGFRLSPVIGEIFRIGDTTKIGESLRYNENTGRWGTYRPEESLPRNPSGTPKPSSNSEHTQIGTATGRNGNYTQTMEWRYSQPEKTGAGQTLQPYREINFTDHGRASTHDNPHQHMYTPNPTGGTYSRGSGIPFP